MRSVDHYIAAEQLLQSAAEHEASGLLAAARLNLLHAQTHATLALAGATALQAYTTGDEDELADWETIAGRPGGDHQ